jgi:predicted secreted protein
LGLGDGREIYILSSERQPNRITKDEIKNKKLNKEISGGATGDITKADEMHVRPAIAKHTAVSPYSNSISKKHTSAL